jgi:hypothetical protein
VSHTLRSLAIHEVDDAPQRPGLYAWYGSLAVGRADWEELIQDGQDLGDKRSRAVIRGHAGRHTTSPLSVSAKAGFELEYAGTLSPKVDSELIGKVSAEPGEMTEGKVFDQVIASVSMRRTLLDVLAKSAPVFATPLYIGVSNNLRDRLKTHATELITLWGGVSRDPEYLATLVRDGGPRSTFAFRAVSRGFSTENVRVWFSEIELAAGGQTLSDVNQKDVAEAAEWILNRCHRPLLGRK